MKASRASCHVPGLFLSLGLLVSTLPAADRVFLTNEHADLRIVYDPSADPPLAILARDEDRRINHPSTNVVLMVPEAARFELPPGTPFGGSGESLWILPQNQFPDLLYLGFSAESIPSGVFDGSLTFRLSGLTGPGAFIAWQAASFGEFLIKFDSRDGISDMDRTQPIIGSHEHFNWGFSQPGVYAVTFQIEGRRAGAPQLLQSRPTTFVFHVEPIPQPSSFVEWQRLFFHPDWPEEFSGNQADADADGLSNQQEYVLGTNPCAPDSPIPIRFALEERNGGMVGTLRYTRRIGLPLGQGTAEVANDLSGPWVALTEEVESLADPVREQVLAVDAHPVDSQAQRFYRIRWH